MKVGIMTYHHSKRSYGACLQAFALANVCKKYVSQVELVNYQNDYEKKAYKRGSGSLLTEAKRLVNFLARVIVYSAWYSPYNNISFLDSFYGCVSKDMYHNIDDLKNLHYDALITGSDQVWNPEITGGIDEAFFLNFSDARKRISYAASMGSYSLDQNEKNQYKKLLSNFTSISVREDFAKKQLQELTEKDIKVVLDPTLLLDHSEWKERIPDLCEVNKPEKYILTFFVTHGFTSYSSSVKKYSEELSLPIWNIQAHRRKYNGVDRVVQTPTIGEFLQLIQNASLIITNSFHGTAFSIIFHKDFVSLVNADNPTRVKNLLDILNLSERINVPVESLEDCINYDEVDTILDPLRKESETWLKDWLLQSEA